MRLSSAFALLVAGSVGVSISSGSKHTRGGFTNYDSAAERDLQVSSEFTIDLRNALCPGLVKAKHPDGTNQSPSSPINDAASCEAACASDPGCDLWQLCPPAESSCPLYDGVAWTPGDWGRCYVSTSTSSRDGCVPDPSDSWLGAARSDDAHGDRVPSRSEPADAKRGFSGYLYVDTWDGSTLNPTCHDAAALGLENSWYYNWQARTSSGEYCRDVERLWGAGTNNKTNVEAAGGGVGDGKQMGGEFVPMLIGIGQAANKLAKIDSVRAEWERGNAHYLLGYNEPDPSPNHPHSEPNHTLAAEDWVLVQQVAASFDPPLKLVSPAPASEDFDEDGRSTWLDLFLGNCTHVVAECDPSLIEYIAFHDYKGDVGLLERRINGMVAHYGRPLWLTEYSIGRWTPSPLRPEQEDYMRESLALLENHPAIYRYVWFHSRDSPERWGGVKDLLVWNETEPIVTTTGEIYKTFPRGPSPTAAPTAPVPTPVPTPEPTPKPTPEPTTFIYEPEPGLHLLLSEPGESCTSACARSNMFCTYSSLAFASSYGTFTAIDNTAAALGVTCTQNRGDKTGKAFPQIRPDKAYCFAKASPATNYECDAVSTWVVLGQRICSCIANTGMGVGESCEHFAECNSLSCQAPGICA